MNERPASALFESALIAPLEQVGALAIFAEAETVLRILPEDRLRLPDEEDARIARYRQPQDRAMRRAAHGLVRHCLSQFLGVAPQSLHFTRDERGRPSLAPGLKVDFNLSHSGGFIGVGLSTAGRIGIDVQDMSQSIEWRSFAQAFLNAAEWARVEALPQAQQNAAALEYWSLKEAFLKATGEGIALAPHHLSPQKADGALWMLSRGGFDLRAAAFHLLPDACAAWASSGPAPDVTVIQPLV